MQQSQSSTDSDDGQSASEIFVTEHTKHSAAKIINCGTILFSIKTPSDKGRCHWDTVHAHNGDGYLIKSTGGCYKVGSLPDAAEHALLIAEGDFEDFEIKWNRDKEFIETIASQENPVVNERTNTSHNSSRSNGSDGAGKTRSPHGTYGTAGQAKSQTYRGGRTYYSTRHYASRQAENDEYEDIGEPITEDIT